MTEQARESSITIGSKTYAIQTLLPPEDELRIKHIAQDLFGSLSRENDQEQKLVIGWLLMAYRLEQAQVQLEKLLALLHELSGTEKAE